MKIKKIACLIMLGMSIAAHAGPSTQPKKADAVGLERWAGLCNMPESD